MKVKMDETCLRLEAETQRDAFIVGQISQAALAAGMDCTSGGDLAESKGDYVILGLNEVTRTASQTAPPTPG